MSGYGWQRSHSPYPTQHLKKKLTCCFLIPFGTSIFHAILKNTAFKYQQPQKSGTPSSKGPTSWQNSTFLAKTADFPYLPVRWGPWGGFWASQVYSLQIINKWLITNKEDLWRSTGLWQSIPKAEPRHAPCPPSHAVAHTLRMVQIDIFISFF